MPSVEYLMPYWTALPSATYGAADRRGVDWDMMNATPYDSVLGRAIRFVMQLANRHPGATECCDVCGRETDLRRTLLLNGRFHCDRCAKGFHVDSSALPVSTPTNSKPD
jgi:hypothetical protein